MAKGNSKKAYIGGFISGDLKNKLDSIARHNRRSLNAQVEIFLEQGVQHLKASEPVSGCVVCGPHKG